MNLKFPELMVKPKAALLEQLNKLNEDLFKLRFKRSSDSLKTPHLLKRTKRDIARINTALTQIAVGGDK